MPSGRDSDSSVRRRGWRAARLDLRFLGIMTKRSGRTCEEVPPREFGRHRRREGRKQVLLLDLRDAGFDIQPFSGNLNDGITARGHTRQGLRQVFQADSAIALPAHRHRIFDCILKFADVSGPGIARVNFQNVPVEFQPPFPRSANRTCLKNGAPKTQCRQAAHARAGRGLG